jgi:bacteriocin-like protein
MATKTRLSKDELKKVSGGTIFRAKVSVDKVRNKPAAGGHRKVGTRRRARD